MVYRNLNGTSASSLELANGQTSSKHIEATDRGLRITGSDNLVPLEVGDPEEDVDAVNLKYFKKNTPTEENYLPVLAVKIADEISENQPMMERRIIDAIDTAHPNPIKGDAMPVKITFDPSGTRREVVYTFDGNEWKYKTTTTSDLLPADDDVAGLVRSSSDIDYDAGLGKVLHSSASDSIGGLTVDEIARKDEVIHKGDVMTNEEIDSMMGL